MMCKQQPGMIAWAEFFQFAEFAALECYLAIPHAYACMADFV